MFQLFQNYLHQMTFHQIKILDLGLLRILSSVSLQAFLEKYAQISTFTETEQTFFLTTITLFDGEETIILVVWIVLRT